MINEVISTVTDRMQKTVEALRRQMASLRAGQATPALVEHIRVDYYGTLTPLNQLATISTPEVRLLMIQPWERTILADVEKAIYKSDLGLNPSNDGSVIRLAIPPLTEERRRDLVKVVQKRVEESRVSLRQLRRDSIQQLKAAEQKKEISQDECRRVSDRVQAITDDFVREVEQVGKGKEKEILEF